MGQRHGPVVLAAPDSFKGTFFAGTVAEWIARGIRSAGAVADECPVGDGGEGTMRVLVQRLGGRFEPAAVRGPLGQSVRANLAMLPDGITAVVEAAEACGWGTMPRLACNLERASTYGVGELIVHAARLGARRVLVTAGGTATVDGGMGAVMAIEENGGSDGIDVAVLCDVATGFEDAARVFGPQKGADPNAVGRMTARLHALATALPKDPRGVPMTGSAGGLAGGLWAACGATLPLEPVQCSMH